MNHTQTQTCVTQKIIQVPVFEFKYVDGSNLISKKSMSKEESHRRKETILIKGNNYEAWFGISNN